MALVDIKSKITSLDRLDKVLETGDKDFLQL